MGFSQRSACLAMALSSMVLPLILAASIDSPAQSAPLYKEDFESGAGRWEPTDPKAWRILQSDRGRVYSLFQQSNYEPPHRSPVNYAILKDFVVSDFVLEARVQSTVKDYDHRDMCVIFGYQDSAHFYYVHFGKKTDDHANQIFIVNAAPRIKISTKTTSGTAWDDEWHRVKVSRRIQDGAIEVFFDDLKSPIMTANDKTFAWGRIGVGSFDDTGNWDDVILSGTKVQPK